MGLRQTDLYFSALEQPIYPPVSNLNTVFGILTQSNVLILVINASPYIQLSLSAIQECYIPKVLVFFTVQ